MILIKSPREIEAMRRAGAVVGQFFEEVRPLIRPGVSTWDLEAFADRFIARNGVRTAFKGYMGYPAHLCTSINEEAVQEKAEAGGFSVVRDFVGHGIGRLLHEDPQIPNFGKRGTGPKLTAGMVLAIEPMVNAGGWSVEVLSDGWTVVTRDRSRSAHFEHTVAVTEDGNRILSFSLDKP